MCKYVLIPKDVLEQVENLSTKDQIYEYKHLIRENAKHNEQKREKKNNVPIKGLSGTHEIIFANIEDAVQAYARLVHSYPM